MTGLVAFLFALSCGSSSSLEDDEGLESDVAEESISGLDVGLTSVDV
jgi:hypothetical protein